MDSTSIIMTIIILFLIVVLFLAVSFANKKIDSTKKIDILNKLKDLGLHVQSLDGAVRRDSIVKLDNLLTKALQYYFHNSNTCGDNLKKSNRIFKKKELDGLWEAHKIRNNIVHNDYDIDQDEALETFNVYNLSIRKILK